MPPKANLNGSKICPGLTYSPNKYSKTEKLPLYFLKFVTNFGQAMSHTDPTFSSVPTFIF